MKIYLDLLPEERKEEIRKNKIFFKIIGQEAMLTIPIAAFIIILLITNFCLGIRISGLEENGDTKDSNNEYKILKVYEEKFKEINSQVAEMSSIQRNHLNWTVVFHKLEEAISDNVYLSDFTTDNYKISLAGRAKTRSDFLSFQEKIKSENCFANVNVPLSSLVSRENLDFQMDFEVREECLKINK